MHLRTNAKVHIFVANWHVYDQSVDAINMLFAIAVTVMEVRHDKFHFIMDVSVYKYGILLIATGGILKPEKIKDTH